MKQDDDSTTTGEYIFFIIIGLIATFFVSQYAISVGTVRDQNDIIDDLNNTINLIQKNVSYQMHYLVVNLNCETYDRSNVFYNTTGIISYVINNTEYLYILPTVKDFCEDNETWYSVETLKVKQ